MGCVAEASKHRLVVEIRSAPKRTGEACPHHPHPPRSNPRFIDWYLLLGVRDDAKAEVIRRRYHKLALQVHPDKNDHPDAEIAFKLLLEAYKCLSDTAKRRSFDEEKRNSACPECLNLLLGHPSRRDKPAGVDTSKNIRDRFREEARVIETCMRSYSESPTAKTRPQFFRSTTFRETAANLSSRKKESSVFDPSRYELAGYPHIRSRADKGIQHRRRSWTSTYRSPVFGGDKTSDRHLGRSQSVGLGS